MTVCRDVETETLGFVGEFSKAPESREREREKNKETRKFRKGEGECVFKELPAKSCRHRDGIEREERRKESWPHHKVQQVELKSHNLHQNGSEKVKVLPWHSTVTFGCIWLVGHCIFFVKLW